MPRLKKSSKYNFLRMNEVLGDLTLSNLQANGVPADATAEDFRGNITANGTAIEFDTSAANINDSDIFNNTYVVNVWDNADDGYAQIFQVNEDGSLTAQGSAFQFETGITTLSRISVSVVNDTDFFLAWAFENGGSGRVRCGVFTVDWSDFSITSQAELQIYVVAALSNSFVTCNVVGERIAIVAWDGEDSDGFCKAVNWDSSYTMSDGALTEFDTSNGTHMDSVRVALNKVLVAYTGAATDGFAVIIEANPSTLATSTVAAAHEFATTDATKISLDVVEHRKAIVVYADGAGAGQAKILTYNEVTGVISSGSATQTNATVDKSAVTAMNPTRAIVFADNTSTEGVVQQLEIDGTDITTLRSKVTFQSGNTLDMTCNRVGFERVVAFWTGVDSDGFAQVFNLS